MAVIQSDILILGSGVAGLSTAIKLAKALPNKKIIVATKNNKDYKISYLFEHDGCKVYRFFDLGNAVYFTSCNGETSYMADSITTIKNTTGIKNKNRNN